MRRWSLGVVIVLAACVGFGSLRSHAANDELKDFMRIKLKHSQDLLTGLVLEDFDQITKNAEALSLLTLAESWQVFQTPDYMEQGSQVSQGGRCPDRGGQEERISTKPRSPTIG